MAVVRRAPAFRREATWATIEAGCLIGTDGVIVRATPALRAMLDFAPHEIERQPFAALTHPDDIGAATSALGWVRDDGSPVRFECRWRHGDATWRWLEWRITHRHGESYLNAVARDITRWKQDEEVALAQARVLEAIASGRGRDGVYTQLCALIESIGPEVRGGVYEADTEHGTLKLAATATRSVQGVMPSETPLTGPVPAGLWLEPAVDFQGVPLGAAGALLGQSRPAGARERQVLQLAAQLLALARINEIRESDARRLARAVDSISDLLVVFAADRQRTVRYVNDAFSRHTGYRLNEVLGQAFPDLAGPESDPAALARIGEALTAGRPVREELLLYTRSGKAIWLDLSLSPVQDDNGGLIEWVYTARDISERKKAERESGKPAETAKSGFRASAADAAAAMVGERWGRSRDSEGIAARPSYPSMPALPEFAEIIDLSELVQGMRHLLAAAVPATTTLNYRLDDRLPAVSGSSDLLRQLVLGLVSHAAHGLEAGCGEISLTTRIITTEHEVPSTAADGDVVRPGSYVALEATDSGRGMKEAAEAIALDPSIPMRTSGRGLGVGAVLGIVRAHRGLIRVLRSADTTTLRILLPVVNGNGRVERRSR